VRSTKKHIIRCFGLKWVLMLLFGPSSLKPAGVSTALFYSPLLTRKAARSATA
jgi:hypothetical protein